MADCGGPPQARLYTRDCTVGAERDCPAAGSASSRAKDDVVPHEWLIHTGAVATGQPDLDRAGDHGRIDTRSAAGLYERDDAAAGAGFGAAERNCDSGFVGRGARKTAAHALDGKPLPCRYGR